MNRPTITTAELARNARRISGHRIPEAVLADWLEQLVARGLLERAGGGWRPTAARATWWHVVGEIDGRNE